MNKSINSRITVTVFYVVLMYVLFRLDFLLFHNLLGLFEVAIGLSLCFISIITLKINRSSLLNLLAPGLLASSVFILLHTLSYTDEGYLGDLQSQNLMAGFWLMAMYSIAIAFLMNLLYERKRVNFYLEMLFYVIGIVIYVTLDFLDFLPAAIDSVTNQFTIVYLVFSVLLCILLFASMFLIYVNRDRFIKYQLVDLELSLSLFLIANILYLFKWNLYFGNEFLVHILRSLGIIYLALSLYHRNIRLPLDSIFMEINQKVNDYNKQLDVIRKNEELFKNLYEKAPVGYIILDSSNKLVYVNEQFMKAIDKPESEIINRSFLDLLDEKEKQIFLKEGEILRDAGFLKTLYNLKIKEDKIPYRIICQLSSKSKGTLEEIHMVLFDVSKEIVYQNEILKNEKNLRNIVNATEGGVFAVDKNGICNFINDNALALLGFESEEEVLYQDIHNRIHRDKNNHSKDEECPTLRTLRTGTSAKGESVFYRKDKTDFPVEVFAYPKIENGEIVGAIVTFKDISKKKDIYDSLFLMSYRDYLTGLYNRRYLTENIGKYDVPENYPISVVIGDVNGLKIINDSFGHQAGDELLIQTSKSILSCTGKEDLVARIGGDEFVVLLPKTDLEKATEICQEIAEKVAAIDINSIKVSISLGKAVKTDKSLGFEDILNQAEDEMYREKITQGIELKNNIIEKINNALMNKVPNFKRHAERVAEIAVNLGRKIRLDNQRLKILEEAAFMHDIGKIMLPIEILTKQGKYTKEEFNLMKKHPDIGYRILSSTNGSRQIAEVILSHHERWDGGGYPRGLKGEQIPLLSRIITIADAFDAMTSERTYRELVPVEEALAELVRCSDTQFDKRLVDVFVENAAAIVNQKQ